MSACDNRNPGRLLGEFPVPDLAQWRAEVERLLKGVPFATAMLTRTLEGLTLDPMPTAADTADLPWLGSLPGQAPFIRGAHPQGYHDAAWWVAQEIPLIDVHAFNAALRSDLARGQTAVNLVLDDAAPQDLQAALEGVDLASTPVMIEAGASALPAASMLEALWDQTGIASQQRSSCLGCDPVFGLARHGRLAQPMADLYDQLAEVTRRFEAAPGVRTLPVHETPWHEGGADHALSLGLTLAGAIHVLREMEQRGIAPHEAARRIHFHAAVDTDFFMSLAKLRALRLLWSRIQQAAGLDPVPAFIHARTSRRMMAALEPYANMLRTTTAAMAAVLGGTDSLHTACFDEAVSLPDEFSRRLARNVQLILRHEVHLDHVADPAGGAWYPEKLTADLAAAAWAHVRSIEQSGGIGAALLSGQVQTMIAVPAAERRLRLATGRDVMVGVNRFVDVSVGPAEAGRVDRDAPRPDHPEVEPIVLRRDAEPFETIRRHVLTRVEGRNSRVFCACLGDGAGYLPRLDFVRGFFQCGGFTVISGGFSNTPGEAAEAAVKADAATVVLVGRDETYAAHAVETARLLAGLDSPPRVILAGKPGPLEADLREAKVAEFLQARSDMLEVLGRLAGIQEVGQ